MQPYALKKGFLKFIGTVSTIVILITSCQQTSITDLTVNFNNNWTFTKNTESIEIMAKDGIVNFTGETVNLPHTANIEPLVIEGKQWQGTCYYSKQFIIPKKYANKHLAVKFEGAMHTAEVYLNGKHIFTNKGGYLPFYIDLTNKVSIGKENTLVVKLNNEDNSVVPPGKPIENLDFNYYSGLYRDVNFIVKDKVHISDPMDANITAGGGILVQYNKISEESAYVEVKVDIENDDNNNQDVSAIIEILDENGKSIAIKTTGTQVIKASSNIVFGETLLVTAPKLWSPSSPYLYTLKTSVLKNKAVVDSQEIKIGIRTFSFSAKDGFTLNGKKTWIRGTNRHQDYPYIGYAISDNANYRDAWKIKKAGFNFVRLSHYPHSVSFMKACDELGLMVMDAIPGWQFFGNEEFQENSLKDVQGMMRRDRNHPCVILWEASLNESRMSKEYITKAHETVHNELPGKDVYTCGWMDVGYDLFIPARQHAKPPHYWNNYKKDKPIFIAEYGDWEYYAQNAGFNQKAFEDLAEEERTSRQLRGAGQKRLTQQALNYQEAHNSNLQGPATGDANWLMFDYNRGYAPDIESSGISDIFRLPKFAYYFYQSQAGPNVTENAEFGEPMIYIANYWNDPTFNDVKVYSNCEEVELFLNGKSIGKQKPDDDKYSTHLKHPPFTFRNVSFEKGTLTAVGFINGKNIIKNEVSTPKKAVQLKLTIDTSGKPFVLGNNDMVFAYASVTDNNGTVVPVNNIEVSCETTGEIQIVGSKTLKVEAGIATFLIKTGSKKGIAKIKVMAEELSEATLKLESGQPHLKLCRSSGAFFSLINCVFYQTVAPLELKLVKKES